jgi:hypothetical protein
MKRRLLTLGFSLTVLAGGTAAAQPPAGVRNVVGSAPRFVPNDIWQRMMERPENAPDGLVVQTDLATAWAALVETFKEFDIPVTFSDKAAGEIGMVRAKLYKRMGKHPISRFLRCGEGTAGPNADMYVVFTSVLGYVRPVDAGNVMLYGLIAGQAVDLPNGRNDVVDCTSSGQFETLIVRSLTKRLLAQ